MSTDIWLGAALGFGTNLITSLLVWGVSRWAYNKRRAPAWKLTHLHDDIWTLQRLVGPSAERVQATPWGAGPASPSLVTLNDLQTFGLENPTPEYRWQRQAMRRGGSNSFEISSEGFAFRLTWYSRKKRYYCSMLPIRAESTFATPADIVRDKDPDWVDYFQWDPYWDYDPATVAPYLGRRKAI